MIEAKTAAAMLKASTLVPAEQVRRWFVVTLEPGVTIDDLREPGFWRSAAGMLHPGDRIEATANDGSFITDLIVADIGKTWARMWVHGYSRQLVDAEEDPDAWKASYRIEQRRAGYTVFRISDDAVNGAHPTYDAAVLHARELHRG
jgi:hypothetical protein